MATLLPIGERESESEREEKHTARRSHLTVNKPRG